MERMSKIFGTDGSARALPTSHPMTAEMALATGRGVAARCLPARTSGKHKIIIGKDTRLSGYMFENALVAGICSMGGDALLVGPMPTPAIAFSDPQHALQTPASSSAPATTRIRTTASRSSARDGYKLPDEMEDRD